MSESYEKGVACIKPDFILTKEESGEPPSKKVKLEDEEGHGKKKRGQFKNRFKQNKKHIKNEKMCNVLIDVAEDSEEPKCAYANCKSCHDVKQFLESKQADISDECPVFKVRGHCPRGITCCFGKSHLTNDGRNKICAKVLEEYQKNGEKIKNTIPKDVQITLKKKKYNFDKSLSVLKKLPNFSLKESGKVDVKELEDDKPELTVDQVTSGDDTSVEVLGPCPNEDLIHLKPLEKKNICWKGKLYLSPLTTLGNLPFRRICKEYGADITCGEMAMATSILQAVPYEIALLKRHESEDLFGIQICGNNPYVMTKCVQFIEENTNVDFVDVNLGCPIDAVYQKGGGSGLLRREKVLESVVRCLSEVSNLPFTIKTRTGVHAGKNMAHRLMPMFSAAGVSLITVHGRTREQRYTRTPDWDYIETCAQAAAPTPVFGNGDILSYQDYKTRLSQCPSVAGVMIGRGALYKPWIFTEIKEERDWDISSKERFDIIKKYVDYGLEHWGSDRRGVEMTRKFLLEWLSFLHRYIPLGLLEQPPQKINERPPRYIGRDDMETLMASTNCADWVKISEMLLGPVPEDFHFLPKHKANSWANG